MHSNITHCYIDTQSTTVFLKISYYPTNGSRHINWGTTFYQYLWPFIITDPYANCKPTINGHTYTVTRGITSEHCIIHIHFTNRANSLKYIRFTMLSCWYNKPQSPLNINIIAIMENTKVVKVPGISVLNNTGEDSGVEGESRQKLPLQ